MSLLRDIFKPFLLVSIGIISAAIGLKGFLLPNDFFDGGAMGIALLLENFTKMDLSLLIVAVNGPFLAFAFKTISKTFAIKSFFAIFGLALLVHLVVIPPVTSDRLLIAIFGGVFLGAGIGFSIRGGAVIDGTEVLAIQVSRKTGMTVGDFITIFNFCVFVVVALTMSLETAMYSMLTYVSASKAVDFILNGIEEYIGVTIISGHFEKVREMLVHDLGRGVTVYKTEGGFGKTGHIAIERKAIFCVVTRLEIPKLLSEIQKIDPIAFVIQAPIKDTRGGMIKKRATHVH